MPFWRRVKPLHEQLAEQADLDIGGEPRPRTPSRLAGLMHGLTDGFLTAPPDEFGRPSPLGEVAIHGVPRARQWDAVVSAEAELPGDGVHFVALPDGTLVVDEDVPDGSLAPLAEAVELTINPPYRAEGIRHDDRLWAVAANRIQVREFPEHDADVIELVEGDQIIVGTRLDGDLYELQVSPL